MTNPQPTTTLEYTAVEHYELSLFIEEVNKHVADNWTPLGGIAITAMHPREAGGYYYAYVQAMTRTATNE